jgi:WD40 repeat protein
LRTFEAFAEIPDTAAFSPDTSRVLAADRGGTIKLFDIATGNRIAATRLNGVYIMRACFSPDGKRLAVVGHLRKLLTGEVRILNADNLQEIWSLKGHTLNVLDAVFSPDGQRLATASADGTVRMWDLAAGQEILKLSGRPAYCIRFVSNGHRLIGASLDLKIRLWDATPLPDQ